MKKERLEKTLDVLVETAGDVSELAKVQRDSADKQHESAHKLERLSQDLAQDVANIKSEIKADVASTAATAARK